MKICKRMLLRYLPVVLNVVQWTAYVKPGRTKGRQRRVLDQVSEHKGFSLTMADSLAARADELAELIGVDGDIRLIIIEETYFLEWFVLVDVTMPDSH